MASRSNSGMGVLVALVIFIMLTITLLLLLMLFYTKADKEAQARVAADSAARDFIRTEERTRDDIGRLKAEAMKDGKSVVIYLRDQIQTIMRDVAGTPNLTPTRLKTQLEQLGMAPGESLTGLVTTLRTQLKDSQDRITSLEGELDTAHVQLADQVARNERLHVDQQATFASLNAEISATKERADRYQAQVQQSEQNMNDRVQKIRDGLEAQIASLNEQLDRSQGAVAELNGTVASLQSRLKESSLGTGDEGQQKDGEIVRLVGNDEVFIDLGKEQHIVLGMTFNVYGSTAEMRPDSAGQVPPGKATIEVTRISPTTSTARIIRSTPGRAVVEGDLIVNPVYDRHKQYAFYVFGQFDLDAENGPSDLETGIVNSRIKEWGGSIRDKFAGDIDFLVLGVAPTMPLPPRSDATAAEVIKYRRERQFYEDYQRYLEQAKNLSIPVLNQNRLLTLIGYYGN